MTKKDLHTKTLEQLLREKDDTHPEGIQGSAPTSLNLQGRFD